MQLHSPFLLRSIAQRLQPYKLHLPLPAPSKLQSTPVHLPYSSSILLPQPTLRPFTTPASTVPATFKGPGLFNQRRLPTAHCTLQLTPQLQRSRHTTAAQILGRLKAHSTLTAAAAAFLSSPKHLRSFCARGRSTALMGRPQTHFGAASTALQEYASSSLTDLPRPEGSTGFRGEHPVQYLADYHDWVLENIEEHDLEAAGFGLRLRVWGGRLYGIVHQLGQFPILAAPEASAQEGEDTPKDAAQIQITGPEEGSRAEALLLADVRELIELQQHAQSAIFDHLGSEAAFQLAPIILKLDLPPPAASTTAPATAASHSAAAAVAAPPGGEAPAAAAVLAIAPPTGGAASAPAAVAAVVNDEEDEEAGETHGAPLESSPEAMEMYQSLMRGLCIAPEVVEHFREAEVFGTREEFLQHVAFFCPTDNTATKYKTAFALLADYVQPPYLEVYLGSEELGYNPIPVLWLGRSPAGNAVGLMAAVVWT